MDGKCNHYFHFFSAYILYILPIHSNSFSAVLVYLEQHVQQSTQSDKEPAASSVHLIGRQKRRRMRPLASSILPSAASLASSVQAGFYFHHCDFPFFSCPSSPSHSPPLLFRRLLSYFSYYVPLWSSCLLLLLLDLSALYGKVFLEEKAIFFLSLGTKMSW